MPAPTSTLDAAALVDVNFLIDLSGSFADDLPKFKTEVPQLIDALAAQFDHVKFSLGSFQDYPIAPFGSAASGDVAYERLVDFNDINDPDNNAGVVKSAIANLTTRFGDDGPQSQLAALYQTVTGAGETIAAPHDNASIAAGQKVHFRSGATKVILLFTDASFHNPGDTGDIPYPGPTFSQTVTAIQATDPPMVIGISSGGGGVPDLQQMAAATGAVASVEGADCDDDGVIDVLAGEPLVCATNATSVGIGNAITSTIDAAIEVSKVRDTDADGLPDLQDNCPTVANANQADLDDDTVGDVCDPDDDNDGINDAVDDCPTTANNDQVNSDQDGLGDACDPDDDNDGILDGQDPCPLLSTPQVITGTANNDHLLGTPGNDLILGLAGNDVIEGRGGNDCLVGGAGSDRILGGAGDDIISGGTENDKLYGEAGNDSLSGADGNDVLVGGLGNDQLEGGNGNDELRGDSQDDDENATQLGGDDELVGGAGDDRLFGGAGHDELSGELGNDLLHGGDDGDEVIGGAGDDRIFGDAGDDLLSGTGGMDFITGGSGNDTLDGGMDSDLLDGGPGDDYLFGGLMSNEPDEVDKCLGGPGTNTQVNCEVGDDPNLTHALSLTGSTAINLAPVSDAPDSAPGSMNQASSCTLHALGGVGLSAGEQRNHVPIVFVAAGLAAASMVRRRRRR
jgi:Ca2+-binding RTX toxin-like protein